MCLSPITIKNLNYGLKKVGYNYLKDCDSQFLSVPCGVCSECIAVKQMNLIQRCQCESFSSRQYFVTLTYNNSMLPIYKVSTGYDIRYADISDIQNMLKRFRKDNILKFPFRYFGVSELGSKKGRPHFHLILFFDKKYLPDYPSCLDFQNYLFKTILSNWCRNVGTKRVPEYVPLCTYSEYYRNNKKHSNYDCHFVLPSLSDSSIDNVCWYVLKYMLKPSDRAIRLQQALHLNLPEDEYNEVWSIVHPRYFKSLGFGLNAVVSGSGSNRSITYDTDIVKYLKSCIHKTPIGSCYPYYFNKFSGQHFPLARYYKSIPQVFDLQDAHDFYFNGNPNFNFEDKSYSDYKRILERQHNLLNCTDSNGDFLTDF